jgi:HD superfamily phosphohydrolase
MMMARGLMYSAVYFHRVTRITELMLSRAVERMEGIEVDPIDMQRMVDAEIWQVLDQAGDFSRDMLTRIKYRQLLKIAVNRRQEELEDSEIARLVELAQNSTLRQEIEAEIAGRAGVPDGYVALDVPSVKLLLSEPRMAQVDIRIIGDDGVTRWFTEHTPIAEALRERQVSQSVMYVATLPQAVDKVAGIAERVIFA